MCCKRLQSTAPYGAWRRNKRVEDPHRTRRGAKITAPSWLLSAAFIERANAIEVMQTLEFPNHVVRLQIEPKLRRRFERPA